jgi:membrane-anchored glycerophosphoryl diester phosphodiesterase (GDPDase)
VYEKPTAPTGIGGVLDDGLRLWRLSLPLTWGLALVAQAIKTAPAILFPTPRVAVPASNLDLAQKIMSMAGATSRASLLAIVFGFIAYIFVNAVLLRINAVSEHRQMSFSESLAAGLKLLPRTIGFFFLLGLMIGLPVLVAVIPAVIFKNGPGGSVMTGLLLMVAGLLIVYVAIKMVVGYPAVIVDDQPATDAISTSWKLTGGFWWRVATLLAVLGVIGAALGAVLGLLGAAMFGWLGVASRAPVLVTQLASIVVYSFLGSLSPAVILAIYNDLKLRKEGGDLADRVSALAAR